MEKVQTYITMASIVGIGFLSIPLYAEESVYSPVFHADVSQVDWMADSIHHVSKNSDEEKQKALEKLLEKKAFQILPVEWREAVLKSVDTFIIGCPSSHVYLATNMLDIYLSKKQLIANPVSLEAIRGWIGLPQPEDPIHPQTGKPYVRIPKKMVAELEPSEILYVKKVLKVVNQNLHYLNSLPPTMDPEKMEQGDYIGYAFWPLTLVQPKVLYENPTPHITNELRYKGHKNLVQIFANGDEELYDLQSQMGTPFYNPHLVRSHGELNPSTDCYQFIRTTVFGIRPVILGYCESFEYLTRYAYKIYFEETEKSFPIMRDGLSKEIETYKDQPKLHNVLTHIQSETDSYLEQMQQAVDYIQSKIRFDRNASPYTEIKEIPQRLLDVHVVTEQEMRENQEKELQKKLTPKEKRLLKRQQRLKEKELKKKQRQRS